MLPQDPRLPRDWFERLPALQNGTADWIVAEAPTLYARASKIPGRRTAQIKSESLELLPYPVGLRCLILDGDPSAGGGRVGVVRAVNEERLNKIQRVKRICAALSKKSRKMHSCKERGARTVLVLESDDIALTNSVFARQAPERAALGPDNLPDEIYFVETTIDTWAVFPMNNAAAEMFRDDLDSKSRYCRRFDSLALVNLMNSSKAAAPCEFCLEG